MELELIELDEVTMYRLTVRGATIYLDLLELISLGRQIHDQIDTPEVAQAVIDIRREMRLPTKS